MTIRLTRHTIPTPDGPFTTLETGDGPGDGTVVGSGWTDDVEALLRQARMPDDHDVTDDGSDSAAVEAVRAYYDGHVPAIDTVHVHQDGTQLQHLVWQQLRAIPAGAAYTYSQVAEKIGHPNAFRAVASACARNANALFVPCHRVVASDGSLSGFAWGIDTKRRLLERESALIR